MLSKHLSIYLISFFLLKVSIAQLSGPYTVGGVSPDFPTLDSAMSALSTYGVFDTAIFYIRPGTYPGIKHFDFNNYNRVVFRGESNDAKDVIFACDLITTQNLTLKHVTILPRVNNSSVAPLKGMEVRGFYLSIDSCIIQGPTGNPNYNTGIWVRSKNTVVDKSVSITNTKFKNLDYGIVFSDVPYFGSSRYWGTYKIANSEFDSCKTAIYILGEINDSLIIDGNIISNMEYGIRLEGKNVTRTFVRNNRVIDASSIGIYINNLHQLTKKVILTNNFVTGGMLGWNLNGSTKVYRYMSISIVNSNRVNLINNSVNGGVNIYNSDDIKIFNNNFSTSRSLPLNINSSTISADYNNFYSEIGDFLIAKNNNLYSGVPSSIIGTHSMSHPPFFISSTDLHSYSPFLQHAGSSTYAPNYDIDDEVRNSLPDIGADEFQASLLFPFAWFEHYCEDDTLGRSFSNISVRADSSFWQFGDGNTSNLMNPKHTYSNYGTYLCTLTTKNPFGQSVFIDTIILVKRNLEKIILNSGALSISPGYSYYQWYRNGNILNGSVGKRITLTATGHYEVVYHDEDECERISAYSFAVGLQENIPVMESMIYPNPADEYIIVKSPNIIEHINIRDQVGKLVLSYEDLRSNKIEIPVSDLRPGMYFIEYNSGKGIKNSSFVKR